MAGSLFRKPLQDYEGRLCGCAPGTHDALVEMICQKMQPTAGVLDIGAHSGALLMRLKDRGFTDLTGTDLDTTRFDVPGAKFLKLELNAPFSREFDRKFRLITCTDVIEHLDSPRNFLNEARQLLEDDGFLALSLPNVAYWEGRVKFLCWGELWGFGRKNYAWQRHISPITFQQMEMMLREIGYEDIACGTGGSFATTLRTVVTLPLWAPLRLVGGKNSVGESALFVARKSLPQEELKQPVHYRKRWQGIPDKVGFEDRV